MAEITLYDLNGHIRQAPVIAIAEAEDAYHNQIKENMDKLKGKIVFDTRKCCDLPGTYRL